MNMFIPVYHDETDLEDVEGIIRSDSIVEVWKNNGTQSVTIRYRAPSDGHIVEHDEYFDSCFDTARRFSEIAQHIIENYKDFHDIKLEKETDKLIKELAKSKEVI